MNEQTATRTESPAARAGKFLTFALGAEVYGLEILKVREIIGMTDVTSVPRVPEFVKGVVNLRGRVIPVMDLRARFGMPPTDRTGATCIIVVLLDEAEMGLIVDQVLEVQDIPAGQIEQAPSFGVDVDTEFIQGIGKTDGKVILLLDINAILTTGKSSLPRDN